jgi:hypothetical protein
MLRRAMLIVTLGLTLTGRSATAAAEGKKLVVVVAKGSSLTSISRAELRRCFLGEPSSAGGKRLVPFNATPATPERSGFDRAVLGMDPDEVGRFWVDRKIRGQAPAPRSLPSTAHVVKVVAKFPNAIGYVPADELTAELQPVAVDGISPDDTRYSIRVP